MSTSVQVKQFHEVFGHVVRSLPKLDVPQKSSRLKFIKSEWVELKDAIRDRDFVEILDALADIEYFVHGTALTFGINIDAIITRISHLAQRPLDEEMAFLEKAFDENNIDEVGISLANISIIVHKMSNSLNVDLRDVIKLVHESNMTKLWDDGLPRFDEDDKVIKGPNYVPPTVGIEALIAGHPLAKDTDD